MKSHANVDYYIRSSAYKIWFQWDNTRGLHAPFIIVSMLILPKIVKCYMQNKRNYTHCWKKPNISYLSTVTQSTYTSFVIVQFYRLFLYWHQTFAERGLKLKHRILPSSNKMYKNSFIICHFTQFLQNTSDFVYS